MNHLGKMRALERPLTSTGKYLYSGCFNYLRSNEIRQVFCLLKKTGRSVTDNWKKTQCYAGNFWYQEKTQYFVHKNIWLLKKLLTDNWQLLSAPCLIQTTLLNISIPISWKRRYWAERFERWRWEGREILEGPHRQPSLGQPGEGGLWRFQFTHLHFKHSRKFYELEVRSDPQGNPNLTP